MLKVYTLSAAELGLAALPAGEMRFDEFIPAAAPEEADVILCPAILFNLHRAGVDIRRLPTMARWSRKHVFWDMADSREGPEEFFPGVDSIFLRAALTTRHVEVNPRSRAFAWPVSQNGWFDDWETMPASGTERMLCSLHVFNSCGVRKDVFESCLAHPLRDRCDVILYPDFTGSIYDTPEGLRRRGLYRESLRNSLFAMCPRSIPGNPAYRLYEAMAAGRVAMHFCDRAVLPFPREIDWNRVTVQLPEADAPRACELAAQLLGRLDVEEILRRGREARRAWEDYLDDRAMPRHHRRIVENLLAEEGRA